VSTLFPGSEWLFVVSLVVVGCDGANLFNSSEKTPLFEIA
jgi:hypothetical protein